MLPYILNFIKNRHYQRPFNVALISPDDNVQVQPLESIRKKTFSHDVK